MKVRPNQQVYCIFQDSILAYRVYAVGDTFFMLDPHGSVEESWEWDFEDFEKTWFKSLSKAKKALLAKQKELYSEDAPFLYVEKLAEDYYEVRDKRYKQP